MKTNIYNLGENMFRRFKFSNAMGTGLLLLVTFMMKPIMATPTKKTIVMIRHGESRHNIEGTFNSNPLHPNYKPSELTKIGLSQIKVIADHLKKRKLNKDTIDSIFVSPMIRTQQTARILAEEGVVHWTKFRFSAEITETHYGDLEGQNISQWKASKMPFVGESYESRDNRLKQFIFKNILVGEEKNIVVVTHAGIIKGLVSLMGQGQAKTPEHGSMTVLDINCDNLSKRLKNMDVKNKMRTS